MQLYTARLVNIKNIKVIVKVSSKSILFQTGWRHLYNFSWGDLEACLASVRESDRSIAAGLCKVFYNGRIHWEQDMNLMSSLLDKHFDESVLGHTWKPLGLDVSLPMTSKLQVLY